MWVDASLWSADLGALRDEIRRFEPWVDSFHVDVSDDHFVGGLLFFPELLAKLRPATRLPFHVHLMVEHCAALAAEFTAAGADWITVQFECAGAGKALEEIRDAGRRPGLALQLETPVERASELAPLAETLLLLGTPAGVKGRSLDEAATGRLREAKSLFPKPFLVADGGIRRETVPLLQAAGADAVVPGSLLFGGSQPDEISRWLKAL